MKFKNAFQLWQAKRGVDSPLPSSIKETDYQSFKSRLMQCGKTPEDIIEFVTERSKTFFHNYVQPTLRFRTTHKACLEASSHQKYVQEKYNIPKLPSYATLQQLTHHVRATNLPIDLCVNPSGRSKQLDEPMKIRTITAMNHEMFLFKDIQESLLEFIQKHPSFGLTKNGEDIPTTVKSLLNYKGLFCSGDFDAATDNIFRDIIKAAISGLPVYETVKQQFYEVLVDDFYTTNGQLMGSILSFPILCVINLFVHEYCQSKLSETSPPYINGDDILFRASKDFIDLWLRVTKSCGLIPSKGKNLISERYFTINSRPFLVHNGSISKMKFANLKLTRLPTEPVDVVECQCSNIKKFSEEFFHETLTDKNINKCLPYFRSFGKHKSFRINKKYRSDHMSVTLLGTGLFPTDIEKMSNLQTSVSYHHLIKIKTDPTPQCQRDLKVRTFLLKEKRTNFRIPKPADKRSKHLHLLRLNNELIFQNLSERYQHQEGVWAFIPNKMKVATTALSWLAR